MGRSTKKGPYVDQRLLEKIDQLKAEGGKKVINTWARNCVVTPDFVGVTLGIHNGRKFIPVYITEQMVGHRLGEFSPTRFFKGHGVAHTKEASSLT